MDLQSTDWEIGVRLRRGSWLIHAALVELKAARLAEIIRASAKFDPNQPRVSRGNPDGGQWASTGGGGGESSTSESRPRTQGETASRNGIQLAGGFTDEQMGLTVQRFASAHCRGLIHRVLPGEFLDMTIADVMTAAKGGDAAARTCLKLLKRDDYRK